MSEIDSGPDLLNELAHEFAERFRRGERPSVTEYTGQHPELAAEIRDLFPALAVIEQFGSIAGPPTGPHDRAATADGTMPRQLGEYRILREVARGGMGIVYEAVQESLGRHVALKVLPFQSLADPNHLERFRREAQAAARLHHTNIVPVFGVGEHEGVHYFAMQFITGQPLDSVLHELGCRRRAKGLDAGEPAEPPSSVPAGRRDLELTVTLAEGLRTGRFPGKEEEPRNSDRYELAHRVDPVGQSSVGPGPSNAMVSGDDSDLSVQSDARYFRSVARVGVQVAEALDYAHQQGIVHRDIKPSNLLLDTQGTVWITDFGLAKAEGTDELTGPGDLLGTLRYMAPERFQGRADPRSDVFSLGLTLYEMATLRPAFAAGERVQLIERMLHAEPPGPRQLDGRIPRDLETMILKAIAKEPGRRYQTAGELAEDLQRFLADRPIQARRSTTTEQFGRWCRRNPVLAGLAGTVLTLLAAAMTILSVANVRIARERHAKGEALEQAKGALGREKQSNDALVGSLRREERTSYFRSIALAERELAANNVGRAEELLDDCPLHLRGWEWHHLKRRPFGPVTFRGHRSWVLGVAFSPDGKLVASASSILAHALGEIKVWDRTTGKEVYQLLGHVGPVDGVAFNPDGKLLASAGWDRTVKVWDITTGKERHTLRGHTEYVNRVAFSPDGKFLASASGDRTAIIWDATTFQKLRTLHGHSGGLYGLAMGPGGRLASTSSDGTVRVWDAENGRELHTLRGHAGAVLGVSFGRDGRHLASGGFDGAVRVWDALSGDHLFTFRADTGPIMSLAFSPDGRRLATGGFEQPVHIWDLETRQEGLALRGHEDLVTALAFSADGQQIASASMDGTVKIWDADASGPKADPEVLTLRNLTGAVISVAFHPDGDRLASTSSDETVRLWNVTTGEELAILRGHIGPVGGVVFSRDGRTLATAAYDGGVKVWDVETGKERRTFRGSHGFVALSPDGRWVASAREGALLCIWDTATGREAIEPFRAHAAPIMGLAISLDGQRLATTAMDGTAKVWDATTGRAVQTFTGHRSAIQSGVFSADRKRLATASWDKTAKTWDVATGRELLTLRGHENRVLSVAFSPNGKRLATASWDNTVRIWDAATGKPIATLRGHTGYVFSVAFSPDGKRLASSSGYRDKGEIKVWDATRWDEKSAQ